ncbi:hypothetical protein RFI_08904 [Reticulomyxa filosa]|uniref:Protein kinase domain-containing protein n=1 Tax=Reticulomyxa filosa TaxID=46433 RepID=X6NR72_RETFI|nr:hypothetical protein RFI_08904 [Reticulomyxa filosa]|eukprot:ETO28229.1 hypothetical protein RFI_08904 [Reticulomyxa filosa]
MGKKLHLKTIKSVIRQLLRALVKLHKVGIVHRDMKPENVVVMGNEKPKGAGKKSKRDRKKKVKVIDFGSGLCLSNDKALNECVDSQWVGTLNYMAPEKFAPHPLWQMFSADVWSIGVICYEMFFQMRLFPVRASSCFLKGRITTGTWTFPSDCRHVSSVAKHFIQSLLAINPNRRCTAYHALAHPFLSKRFYSTCFEWQSQCSTYAPNSLQ